MLTTVLNLHHKVDTRDPDYVYVGRNSPYGNPFTHQKTLYPGVVYVGSREEAIVAYRLWLTDDTVEVVGWRKPTREEVRRLRGKKLGCFCKPQGCHGDVLADLAGRDDW